MRWTCCSAQLRSTSHKCVSRQVPSIQPKGCCPLLHSITFLHQLKMNWMNDECLVFPSQLQYSILQVSKCPDPFQPLCRGLRCQQRCQPVQCQTWGQMIRSGHLGRFTWLSLPVDWGGLAIGFSCYKRTGVVCVNPVSDIHMNGTTSIVHVGMSWRVNVRNTLVPRWIWELQLRVRKSTIWCLHDWSYCFEPPRYLLLSPRCLAVGALSCASVLLAHVVLKLIADSLDSWREMMIAKLRAAEMLPF